MSLFRKYKFTKMHHPKDGIMSFVLGLISLVTVVVLLGASYRNEGATIANALSAVLALIFGLIGFCCGVVAECHREVYRFFPNLGIALNFLSMLLLTGLLYFGGAF